MEMLADRDCCEILNAVRFVQLREHAIASRVEHFEASSEALSHDQ